MFCTNCGTQCDDGIAFCTSCGTPLKTEAAQQPVMNEFFPCGIFQPPGVEVFGVIENAVIYGNEMYSFENIDGIHKQNDSTVLTNGVYQMKAYGRTTLLVYANDDRDRALYALSYAQKKVAEAHGQQIFERSKDGLLYDLKGVRGRHMEVYEDRVVLRVSATFGSFITGNISDGEKTIYFSDCVGVQFKESGMLIGYIQLETPGMTMNNAGSNFFNENTFTWDTTVQTNEFMHQVAGFLQDRVRFYKQQRNAPAAPAISGADELKKFKELLDLGVITQEEFDKKKQQILGF